MKRYELSHWPGYEPAMEESPDGDFVKHAVAAEMYAALKEIYERHDEPTSSIALEALEKAEAA